MENKMFSILSTIYRERITEVNSIQPAGMDIPTNMTISVGAPIDIFEGTDNTMDSEPVLILSHDRSSYLVQDMQQRRDSMLYWRMVCVIPDASGGVQACNAIARLACLLAFDTLERHAVDPPDDVSGICWRVNILDSQPMLLHNGHGAKYVCTFTTDIRSDYGYEPWESRVSAESLYTPLSPFYVSSTISLRVATDPFIDVSTNTRYTYDFSGATLTTLTLAGPFQTNAYVVSGTTGTEGQILAVSATGDNTTVSLAILAPTWLTLNSGQFVTLYITGWNPNTSSMYTLTLRIRKTTP
jgi:hypothetical protein